MSLDIPLSLYIHIPWCLRKCPYCDFNSHQIDSVSNLEDRYLQALFDDLDRDLQGLFIRPLVSIFIGGGTPSLFSAKIFEKLLRHIEKRIPFSSDIEITLEANPGTFEYQKFKDYLGVGINRFSIGVQSFQDTKLKALGRIHSSAEAQTALETLHKIGCENFNIDLMYGLPDQTVEDALFDIQTAINLQPKHLSWYELTIEPNTVFYKHPPKRPVEKLFSHIESKGKAVLSNAGFQNYEVSAYCQPGFQAKHNINYWQFGDYLGIGAGAHAKITLPNMQIVRTQKMRQPHDYLNPEKEFVSEKNIISENEYPFQFMMNALRLNSEISWELFTTRTGLNYQSINTELESLKQKNLLTYDQKKLQLTTLGKRYLNEVLQHFL